MTSFVECSGEGGYSESELPRGVLVVRYELDQAGLVGLKGLTGGGDDFKVGCEGGFGGEGADLPGRGLTDTDFSLADTLRFLVGGDYVSNDSRHLELFGRLTVSSPSMPGVCRDVPRPRRYR
jgi:hypothetical protein